MPTAPGGEPPPTPPDPQQPLTRLGGLLASRKGLLTQNVLAMVTVFAAALSLAAVFKVIAWERAFELGALALAVFGGQSATHTVGIALEDAAKFRAATPQVKIDANSSATQVTPVRDADPDATLDPGKPPPPTKESPS